MGMILSERRDERKSCIVHSAGTAKTCYTMLLLEHNYKRFTTTRYSIANLHDLPT